MSHMQMTLFNGRRVNPQCITAADIDITNVAHALSNLCRFGGHSREFYSVAQHSVRVALAVPRHLMLEGLLHDAPEHIVQDLVRPVKVNLASYKALERDVWNAMALKFNMSLQLHPAVLYADNAVLKAELQQFMNGSEAELSDPFWEKYEAAPHAALAWTPSEAKGAFLMTFADAICDKLAAASPVQDH